MLQLLKLLTDVETTALSGDCRRSLRAALAAGRANWLQGWVTCHREAQRLGERHLEAFDLCSYYSAQIVGGGGVRGLLLFLIGERKLGKLGKWCWLLETCAKLTLKPKQKNKTKQNILRALPSRKNSLFQRASRQVRVQRSREEQPESRERSLAWDVRADGFCVWWLQPGTDWKKYNHDGA